MWGLWLDETLIGHACLHGESLPSEMHRARLGMGVRRQHHRRGGGRRLLETAVAWAREQPSIDWVDLGVLHENLAAIEQDRVDGRHVDEITMTLPVAS